jgi:hypothetical protein
MREILHRLKLDKPWDWAGLGIFFMALGFSLMMDVGWWRVCEYAAAVCGLMAIYLHHEGPPGA